MLSDEALKFAIGQLSCLQYFPSESGARFAIMGLLKRMIDEPRKLQWLVSTMVDQVGVWSGPSELRGVYCSRFKPADGIEGYCSQTVGFTPNDLEMKHLEKHDEIKLLEQAESKTLNRILGPGSNKLQ